MDFRLPNLGEGIDAATVVSVLVKPGDAVKAGDNLLSVETDKAAVDVPAEQDGTVESVAVKAGDKVAVGAVVLKFGGAAAAPAAKPDSHPFEEPKAAPAAKADAAPPAPAAPAGKAEFPLPNLGEGIDAATVVSVLVKVGDEVTAGQNVLSVETDKAAVDVPVEAAGRVAEVRVKAGDKVPVGQVVMVFEVAGAAPSKAPDPAPAHAVSAPQKPKEQAAAAEPKLFGGATFPADANPASAPRPHANGAPAKSAGPVAAGPATRRLARELGVALAEVRGSARGGRVTLDDVKGHVRNRLTGAPSVLSGGGMSGKTVPDSFAVPPLPDFGKYGPIEKKAVSGIRKKIAENLTVAWRVMPMVTQHDSADITDLEAGRKRIADALPKGSPKITMTVLAVKAVVAALKEFPAFNSSFDMNAGEQVFKKYYHVGIAVDTERGLVVPVIRDADKKSIRDLAGEITTLAEKARTGKLAVDDMRGGTFTITNLGGIGGTAFTPIVNYPEVAILGLCKSTLTPVVRDGNIVARLMMPMSLSYDHRVIDGADGARFTARLAQLFSDPIRLLMES